MTTLGFLAHLAAVACIAAVGLAAQSANAAASGARGVSEWVQSGADGKLVYKTDAQGNRIPDFSNVGYRGGGVPLPDVPVVVTVEPAPGDATARIQAAIDEVSKRSADAAGHRGAVLIKKGRYPISGTLRLHTSGVVLRGEGQEESGTVLIATGATQRSLIVVGRGEGRASRNPEDDTGESVPVKTSGPVATVIDDYVPVGARTFHVDRPEQLRVGAEIVVRRPSTANWIHDIGMDRIPPATHTVVQWKPGSKDLAFDRTITALAGNTVTIDAPIVCALEKMYGGGVVLLSGRFAGVQEVGVENLRGDSEYASDTDEKHGWVLVELAAARDSWVRDVTAIHFGYSCVNELKPSRAITIDHCTCLEPVSQITGGRRYSFAVDGELTLVQHCRARNGRHDFVMHSTAAGPNVFFDCLAEEVHADSGPHHRWSVGVLYDNVTVVPPKGMANPKGIGLNIRNRGNSGTGHGWAGANQVAWNCRAYEMRIEQPPTAQNWAIGCEAVVHTGDGYWDSFGTPVEPRSLYLAQLRDRLGPPR
jgi:hypothetical protein